MKRIFLAKQGVIGKIIFSFLQCIIILPISAAISLIIALICNICFDTKRTVGFLIAFIILNLLWIIRNSFVVFENGIIKFKNMIGKTVAIDCAGITEIRILDSSAFRNITLNLTREDPLSTNCFGLFLPLNNVIMFKGRDYRIVAIGVHNYKKLIACLEESNPTETTVSVQGKTPFTYRSASVSSYPVKMPAINHIKCYFKYNFDTIIFPFIITAVLGLTLYFATHSIVYIAVSVFLFLMISMKSYIFDVITLHVNETDKAIRLDCNGKEAFGVIKYAYMKELRYLSSLEESKRLFDNKDIKLIKTPHPYTVWENVIYIELQNLTVALLSVKNHEKLYNVLLENLKNDETDRTEYGKITFKTLYNGIVTIKKDDIICVEILKKQVCVTTIDQKLITREKMVFFKDALTDPCFAVPHNSYIINFNFVASYKRDSILLSNQQTVPVAPKKQAETKKKYMHFIGKDTD